MNIAPIFDHSRGDIIVVAGAMFDRNGSETISMPYNLEWEPYARAWRKRVLDEQRDRAAATIGAREDARRAAVALVEQFGCDRVYLFGSLTGMGSSPFGPRSDIDLAVEGLPIGRYFTALAAVENILELGRRFDLVRMEDALPELVARVQSLRQVLADGAAIRGTRRRSG